MECGRDASLNLEASQPSETKQYFVMHQEDGGWLKDWPWVCSVLTQGFSLSLSYGEEVKGTALSFLLGLQSGREEKLQGISWCSGSLGKEIGETVTQSKGNEMK